LCQTSTNRYVVLKRWILNTLAALQGAPRWAPPGRE
jgi:hypothetical protein